MYIQSVGVDMMYVQCDDVHTVCMQCVGVCTVCCICSVYRCVTYVATGAGITPPTTSTTTATSSTLSHYPQAGLSTRVTCAARSCSPSSNSRWVHM